MPGPNKVSVPILHVIDSYTKFIDAVVLSNTTADTIFNQFKQLVIFRYGGVRVVITDNGTEFAGEF